jgi:YozE SAM-like protein
MEFKQWLLQAEVTIDIPGHLVDDLKNDDELPANIENEAQLRAYIERCGACTAALRAIPEVWKRYLSGGGKS